MSRIYFSMIWIFLVIIWPPPLASICAKIEKISCIQPNCTSSAAQVASWESFISVPRVLWSNIPFYFFFVMFQVCDQMACQVFQVHIDKPTRQGWSSADWPGYIFQQTYFQLSITIPFNRAISRRNTFLLHYVTERIVMFFTLWITYAWFDECHYVSNQ